MFEKIDTDNNELAAAAILGAQAKGVEIVTIDVPVDDPAFGGLPSKVPVGLVKGDEPHVFGLKSVLECYRTRPLRKKGIANVTTLTSFIDLVNRHKTSDSAIFTNSNWKEPSLTCVVDYHAKNGTPDNGHHRIKYTFPVSQEWTEWRSKNDIQFDQVDFASFIEDRIEDLTIVSSDQQKHLENLFQTTFAEPTKMVALSRSLQIKAEITAKSAATIQTGEGLISYEEVHNGPDGGKLMVPGVFALSVSPFFLGEKIFLPARLRYRLKHGTVKWSYHLYRPDVYVTQQVNEAAAKAATETDLPTFEGSPEGTGS